MAERQTALDLIEQAVREGWIKDVLREDLNDGNETIRCNICHTRQKIVELLFGFENEAAREQLARVEQKLDQGFADIKQEFAKIV